jgi:hypothetical protein
VSKRKRQDTEPTTSQFRQGTPLVPEDLNPLPTLPSFVKDDQGRLLPSYPQGVLLPWLENIRREAASVLERQGFWKTKRGKTLKGATKLFARPSQANLQTLGLDGMEFVLNGLWRADNESDEIKEALAALRHVRNLQVAAEIMEDKGPCSARTWFHFGAICALYLGAAATRLNLLPFEPNAKLGKDVRQDRSKGGKKATKLRWEKSKAYREWRLNVWIERDLLLRQKHPEWKASERYREIAFFSQREKISGSSFPNVKAILGALGG